MKQKKKNKTKKKWRQWTREVDVCGELGLLGALLWRRRRIVKSTGELRKREELKKMKNKSYRKTRSHLLGLSGSAFVRRTGDILLLLLASQ